MAEEFPSYFLFILCMYPSYTCITEMYFYFVLTVCRQLYGNLGNFWLNVQRTSLLTPPKNILRYKFTNGTNCG